MMTLIYILCFILFIGCIAGQYNQQSNMIESSIPKEVPREIKPHDTKPSCIKCGSTNLIHSKVGYGVGKAGVGLFAVGVFGLLGGFIGSGEIKSTCLNCGCEFKLKERK